MLLLDASSFVASAAVALDTSAARLVVKVFSSAMALTDSVFRLVVIVAS